MMTTEATPAPTPEAVEPKLSFAKRFWPFQWVRDEEFWKDVSSRGLAAGIVALIGVLGANAAGLFGGQGSDTQSQVYYTVLRVLTDIAIGLTGLIFIVMFAQQFAYAFGKRARLQLKKDPNSREAKSVLAFIRIGFWLVALICSLIFLMRVDLISHHLFPGF